MKRRLFLIILHAVTFMSQAQTGLATATDSIHFIPHISVGNDTSVDGITNTFEARPFSRRLDKVTSSRLYRMTFVGVPLIVGGILVKSQDDHFRSLRNDYLPRFKRRADNFTQYAPGALMLSLKAAGLPSRSSWERMLASDAFSAGLMGLVVNTLKHTTRVMRPDGSNTHSFPSGHTATAFMTATMLTKEYGALSPWIGIGSYTVATSTGLMRMANNKHWLSDVMTGAGIGVLSTQLGYFLADLIFKEKGLTPGADVATDSVGHGAKSFLSLYLGINLPLSGYDLNDHLGFKTSSGCTTGIEGAWYIHHHLGLGGRFTATSVAMLVGGNHPADDTFDYLTLFGGCYPTFNLSNRWNVGGKLLFGLVHYPRIVLNEATVDRRNAIGFGSGLFTAFKVSGYYGMRFFLDYDLLPSHSTGSHEYMNFLTLGGAFCINF